jgi:hypothetical protein
MSIKIIKQTYIHRIDLQANPLVCYLFGDNLRGMGFSGQAREMRGEPNGFGIPTKKAPNMHKGSFFTDEEFRANKAAIDTALGLALNWADNLGNGVVVVPLDGLGTGLAELDRRAPKTFAYLASLIRDLEDGNL